MFRLLRLVLPFTLSVFSMSAPAHDFWIVPHQPAGAVKDNVVFELRIGPGWPGKRSVRLPGLISTFDAWDAEGKFPVSGHDGTQVIGHLTNRMPGATVVGLTTNGAQINLSAAEFNDYLQEEGLSKILQSRQKSQDSDQPGTEIFTRFAKAIILVDGRSEGYDRHVGLSRELVLQTDPMLFQPDKPVMLSLLAEGKPLPGIQVKAMLNTSPPTQLKATTDQEGKVTFRLPTEGEWLFSAVDMEPSSDPDAQWHSLWASLTVLLKPGGTSA